MIRNESLLALLLFSIVGSTVLTAVPAQSSYSSSAEETSDEEQQQEEPAGDEEEPVDEEPVDDLETEPADEPNDETNPEPSGEDLADQTVTSGPIVERHPCPGQYVITWSPALCVPWPKGCPDPENKQCPTPQLPPEPSGNDQLSSLNTEDILNGTSTAAEGTSLGGDDAGDPVPDIDVKAPCPRPGRPVCPS